MIKKYDIIKKILEKGIVAVLRSETEDVAERVVCSCIKGNINVIEITFSVPNAEAVIKNLKSKLGKSVTIGAGTVCDEVSARLAILAGAEFIVGPTFNKGVALICNTYGVPYIPGCMTVNEIGEAIKYGVDIIKLFPADQFSLSYIKSIKAPLPQVNIMVSGGIDLSSVGEWIRAGAVAVGVGGNLTSIKDNNYEKIEKISRMYIKEINNARGL